MSHAITPTKLKPLESRTATAGFLLSGLVIAVVAVSYILNSPFPIRWLVWVIGMAFAAVALLLLEWPRGFRSLPGAIPTGRLRQFLLVAIPLAFVLDSQLCGLGLDACSVLCNVISFAMIGLGAVTAVRLHRGQSIGALLLAMVVIGLIPHCTCGAPINTIFHSILGGYSPTCQVMPLAATLFSISALRGFRTGLSTVLTGMMLVVITFIALSNPVLGFPWTGCVG